MTLRDFEKKGRLGCIECYNTFNDYIVKEMFKQQGESTYGGRMPGQAAELSNIAKEAPSDSVKDEPSAKEPVKEERKEPEKSAGPEAAPEKKKDSGELLAKLAKADLGMLSDEELAEGIKLAAENEDYILASKLRDELKGRKGGN